MIKLRLVGSSTDLDHLIFTSRKTGRRGSHLVVIDDKLFKALEDVVRKRRVKQAGEPRKPPPEPKLAPRDVQRLLRAGRSVDQVAKMAGTDVTWVERFLGPVLDERAVAIQSFQRTRLDKPRLGASGAPLGESVERNLRARRVKLTPEELDRSWDASRVDTQPWVITLTFPFRGREQRAVWRYDPHTREVIAGNRLGGDLGWIPDGRRPPPAAQAAPAKSGSTRTAATRAAAKPRTAGKSRAGAKKRTRRTTARKPSRSAGRRKTATRPASRARSKTTTRPRVTATRRRSNRSTARGRTTRRPSTSRRAPANRRTTKRQPTKRQTTKRRTTKRRTTKRRTRR